MPRLHDAIIEYLGAKQGLAAVDAICEAVGMGLQPVTRALVDLRREGSVVSKAGAGWGLAECVEDETGHGNTAPPKAETPKHNGNGASKPQIPKARKSTRRKVIESIEAGMNRTQIADQIGRSLTCVDYHRAEIRKAIKRADESGDATKSAKYSEALRKALAADELRMHTKAEGPVKPSEQKSASVASLPQEAIPSRVEPGRIMPVDVVELERRRETLHILQTAEWETQNAIDAYCMTVGDRAVLVPLMEARDAAAKAVRAFEASMDD